MGRKKSYDEETVLQSAMITFWKKGYKNTSVRTLEKSMGINQFSIYASFDNKKTLFKKALVQYESYVANQFLTHLRSEKSTILDIEAFLKNFGNQIISGEIPNSCLMVNTTSELNEEDADILESTKLFFDKMKNLFTRALENSLHQSLIKADLDIDQSAEYLVGIAQSISIYSKTKNQAQVENYIDFAIKNLK